MSLDKDIARIKRDLRRIIEGDIEEDQEPQTTKLFAEKILDLIEDMETDSARSYYEGKADGMETMAQIIFRSEEE